MASIKIGKWIDKSYHVHHLDGNKSNNDLDNLEIISPKMHSRLHATKRSSVVKSCAYCSKRFKSVADRIKFCSLKCYNNSGEKGKIKEDLDLLLLSRLVYLMPTTKVAKIYGVSDVAIGKLCKKYNINKPSRGYWSKRKASIKPS